LPGRVIFAAVSSDAPPDPATASLPESGVQETITRIEGDQTKIYSDVSALMPVPSLRAVGLTAFVDTPAGPDGVRRVAPMLVRVRDRVYPSLSLLAVLRYWGLSVADVRVRVGDAIYIEGKKVRRRIPIDETGAYFVNYRRSFAGLPRLDEIDGEKEREVRPIEGAKSQPVLPARFNVLSYATVVTDFTMHYVEKADIKVPDLAEKILLVGQMSTGLSDNGPTPFSAETPLVLVHFNVIENILREDYARQLPGVPFWLGGVGVALAVLALVGKRKMVYRAAFGIGLPLVFIGVAVWVWISFSVAVPVVWPLLGFAGLEVFEISRRLLAEQRAKEQIKGMFGTYISPALVNRMVESGQAPQLGGHEDEITAYFSDIQSFSSFSEKLPPDRLVELMNEYLTVCTDIVQEEGGTLDKYIGDAVVAMFGAPLALPDHAFRACVASQRVQQQLGVLREKWQNEGDKWPQIVWRMQSRIGLNTGRCTIGNMGSRTRFNYTMMGDNVNLAARMESGAKSWGVYSMCAEATRLACEKHGGDRLVFRPLGKIVVKGRTQAVPIFEITGLKESVTASTLECVAVFTQGMDCYYARDWAGALAKFRQSAELEPNIPGKTPGVSSNPSLVYQEITAHWQIEPPPDNWGGEYVMKEK
jgi:adenylate cyclase